MASATNADKTSFSIRALPRRLPHALTNYHLPGASVSARRSLWELGFASW
jgi:hypothetical protein